MIRLCHDNILVKEIKRDSKAGALIVNQDESSAYMFCGIIAISAEAERILQPTSNNLLVVRRTAKLPYIQNEFFISYKDVVAVIDLDYMEEI